jgi:cell division cycle 20-like protein 1 (cofactor of APC complex)
MLKCKIVYDKLKNFPLYYLFHLFETVIAWSPHHHGLLASGGGTANRCIRFWNTLTGQAMQCVDTG